jgi:hypothetical protein
MREGYRSVLEEEESRRRAASVGGVASPRRVGVSGVGGLLHRVVTR